MDTFFLVLILLAIPGLVIGLIKPSIFKLKSKKTVSLIFGGIFLVSSVFFDRTLPSAITQEEIVQNNEILEVSTSTVKETPTPIDVKKVTKNSSNIATQSTPLLTNSNPSYDYYSVTDVVDGDTIKVNINGKVETLRLIGLDTPETVDPRKPVQCFGKEASNKAKEILTGKKVRVEKDSTQGELDKYNRLLAYVYREDGLFYNKYMIEQGYAHEYTYNTPYKYQVEFKAAQKSAQSTQLGLWSPNTCNGDTTTAVATLQSTSATTQTQATQSTGVYYTSSHYSSQYYYPEVCAAWKSLSTKYLVSFDTVDDLLVKYKRTLSPQCE